MIMKRIERMEAKKEIADIEIKKGGVEISGPTPVLPVTIILIYNQTIVIYLKTDMIISDLILWINGTGLMEMNGIIKFKRIKMVLRIRRKGVTIRVIIVGVAVAVVWKRHCHCSLCALMHTSCCVRTGVERYVPSPHMPWRWMFLGDKLTMCLD